MGVGDRGELGVPPLESHAQGMTAPDPGDTVGKQQAVGNGDIGTSSAKTCISANNRTSIEVELWKTAATSPVNAQRLFQVLPGASYPFILFLERVKADVEVREQLESDRTKRGVNLVCGEGFAPILDSWETRRRRCRRIEDLT